MIRPEIMPILMNATQFTTFDQKKKHNSRGFLNNTGREIDRGFLTFGLAGRGTILTLLMVNSFRLTLALLILEAGACWFFPCFFYVL